LYDATPVTPRPTSMRASASSPDVCTFRSSGDDDGRDLLTLEIHWTDIRRLPGGFDLRVDESGRDKRDHAKLATVRRMFVILTHPS
jgi:hypothetical protein